MTRDERRDLVVALLRLGAVGAVLYFSLPGDARPPLKLHAWRAGARGGQLLADGAVRFSLWCRTHYWKAVQP